MQTHQLKRNNPNMKRTIVARGGKRGKTAGRGGKGQSARAGNKRRPEWRDIIKRVPKLRGRGISPQKSITDKPVVINLAAIEVAFSANDSITPSILIEKGLVDTISGRIPKVKILGDGEVTKVFKISGLYISESAKLKIEKAGGSVITVVEKIIAKPVKVASVKQAPITKDISDAKEVKTPKVSKVKLEKGPKSEKKPLKVESQKA